MFLDTIFRPLVSCYSGHRQQIDLLLFAVTALYCLSSRFPVRGKNLVRDSGSHCGVAGEYCVEQGMGLVDSEALMCSSEWCNRDGGSITTVSLGRGMRRPE